MSLDELPDPVEVVFYLSKTGKQLCFIKNIAGSVSSMCAKKSDVFVNIHSTLNVNLPDDRDSKSTSNVFIGFKDKLRCAYFGNISINRNYALQGFTKVS